MHCSGVTFGAAAARHGSADSWHHLHSPTLMTTLGLQVMASATAAGASATTAGSGTTARTAQTQPSGPRVGAGCWPGSFAIKAWRTFACCPHERVDRVRTSPCRRHGRAPQPPVCQQYVLTAAPSCASSNHAPLAAGMEDGERPWLKPHVRTPAAKDPEPGATRKRPLIYM